MEDPDVFSHRAWELKYQKEQKIRRNQPARTKKKSYDAIISLLSAVFRKFKRKLKQAVTFRCNHSIEDLCDCLSIMDYFFHEFDDIDDDYFDEEGFYIF